LSRAAVTSGVRVKKVIEVLVCPQSAASSAKEACLKPPGVVFAAPAPKVLRKAAVAENK